MSLTWGHLLAFDSIYPEVLPVEFGPHVSEILAQNSSWAVRHAVTWMLCSHYHQQTAAVASRPLYSHPSCHMHVCGRWWMHRTVWNPIETIGSSAETTCLSDQDFVDGASNWWFSTYESLQETHLPSERIHITMVGWFGGSMLWCG
jgi:hypothetical protein